MSLGTPRIHHRQTGSTNVQARDLARAGAPHGTLVTAAEQLDGRGRQGRSWHAPPGSALLCSLVLRDPPQLLSLAAAVAVAELVGSAAKLKWPNDVLLDGRKVSGILVEGSPREGWAVLGIGVNVAVSVSELPDELRETAGTLGRSREEIEPALARLLVALEHWLVAPAAEVLAAWRSRDALLGAELTWSGGRGVGSGIDELGRLLVRTATGEQTLDAGEVHLLSSR
ncbi:MAG: biotin--[acetyl-CoA-carboxylase] ligase [Solirubrobacteraceae bacterium]|jgi:BirA family biotin operon repressor/biotin-[acetyl-CoA-carboxylase] ligase